FPPLEATVNIVNTRPCVRGIPTKRRRRSSRRLAYTIRKKERGYYVRFDFCGSGQLVGEMERLFRIDERVLKHMSVLLDSEPNVERIQEEMAKAEAAAQKPSEMAATITPAAAAAPESAEPAPQAAAPQPIVPADSQQEA
ncbi:MAG TPA: 30S ribosomal protein S6, partial [Desulfobacterales bacterium]|nr:30S ribosomal protein S6 [Desulfobacterales bacterium]